jgi:hypothetical protein
MFSAALGCPCKGARERCDTFLTDSQGWEKRQNCREKPPCCREKPQNCRGSFSVIFALRSSWNYSVA